MGKFFTLIFLEKKLNNTFLDLNLKRIKLFSLIQLFIHFIRLIVNRRSGVYNEEKGQSPQNKAMAEDYFDNDAILIE